MSYIKAFFIIAVLCIFNNIFAQQLSTGKRQHIRTLIVFFDGLRPDYIIPEQMPNLYAFKQTAAYGKKHHSVFPTVTRVNASSYATGSYPASHGILGNAVYFPAVNKTQPLNTGSIADMKKAKDAEHGQLLTAVSVGELLAKAGEKMMIFSSGSTGQAFLQNHTISGGAIINTDTILPVAMQENVWNVIGKAPADLPDNRARHRWITDALFHFGFAVDGPLVSAIWYSDPDGAAHDNGIGSPEAVESIKVADEQFGRIISYLKEHNLQSKYNIIVSADHGFVTYAGKESLTDFLIQQKFKKDKLSDDIVVAEGAIYVKDHNPQIITAIVKSLQQQEWVGAVFTKGKKRGDMQGFVPGTLSFESVHWDHPTRSGDILVDKNWNDNKNDKGYAGTSFSKGVAGHGSISPYEIHIALIASGPSFKKSFESDMPTSNVDIVPTILYINKIKGSEKMNGRVMTELLSGNNIPILKPKPGIITTQTKINNVNYKLSLYRTTVGKNVYVDYAGVKRD
ncbi:MAG: alkaline phosphatase family protein [Agriterribacter sp.]